MLMGRKCSSPVTAPQFGADAAAPNAATLATSGGSEAFAAPSVGGGAFAAVTGNMLTAVDKAAAAGGLRGGACGVGGGGGGTVAADGDPQLPSPPQLQALQPPNAANEAAAVLEAKRSPHGLSCPAGSRPWRA